jgi:hypothetical protein
VQRCRRRSPDCPLLLQLPASLRIAANWRFGPGADPRTAANGVLAAIELTKECRASSLAHQQLAFPMKPHRDDLLQNQRNLLLRKRRNLHGSSLASQLGRLRENSHFERSGLQVRASASISDQRPQPSPDAGPGPMLRTCRADDRPTLPLSSGEQPTCAHRERFLSCRNLIYVAACMSLGEQRQGDGEFAAQHPGR